jgi:hypothetical protein
MSPKAARKVPTMGRRMIKRVEASRRRNMEVMKWVEASRRRNMEVRKAKMIVFVVCQEPVGFSLARRRYAAI